MNIGFVEVASIVIMVYLVCEWIKTSKLDNKYLPVIAGTMGAVLGVVAYIIGIPDFPANDIFTAIEIGILNGFAATGINQVIKQLGSKEVSDEER